MPGPMSGVKVVELAVWVAGPAASGILADWGADVVKVEAPSAGDPYRAFYGAAAGLPLPINPMFETIEEAVRDPQVAASGAFIDVPVADGDARMLATPVDFDGHGPVVTRGAPETGQHTEEVLLELGYDWNAIAAFKAGRVIP